MVEHHEKVFKLHSGDFLSQIDMHIAFISKQTVRDEVINWFQQSPLHWLLILIVMKYYILDVELSKQLLVQEINDHLVLEGKKTVTTEFRYIDDCESKGFIETFTSTIDARKKLIKPSARTVSSMYEWLEKFVQNTNEHNGKVC